MTESNPTSFSITENDTGSEIIDNGNEDVEKVVDYENVKNNDDSVIGLSSHGNNDDKEKTEIEESSIDSDLKPTPDSDPVRTVLDTNKRNNFADETYSSEYTMVHDNNILPKSSSSFELDKERIRQLENELSEATIKIMSLTSNDINLTSNKNDKIKSDKIADEDANVLVELQANLQNQMSVRAEAEYQLKQTETKLQVLQCEHETMLVEKNRLESEVSKLRLSQQEQQSKETVSTNRINESKKKEAFMTRENIRLEKLNKSLTDENAKLDKSLTDVTTQKEKLNSTINKLKSKCVERVKTAETNLHEERSLNEERKRKMKEFVESKSTELRIAKEQKDGLLTELSECRTKLKKTREQLQEQQELVKMKDSRISDLHGQLSRFKRDSERYYRKGESLNEELVYSMQETEEHKSKRNLAKHELMSVLKKLEFEQSICGKLRDGLKFTFTPKALSQQQLLQQGIESMEVEIVALAKKLGKTLPPSTADVLEYLHPDDSDSNHEKQRPFNGKSSTPTRNKLENDTNRLISNLEKETQRVSQGIMALQSSLERLHYLISNNDERSCFTAIADIISQYYNLALAYSKRGQRGHEHLNQGEDDLDDQNEQEGEFMGQSGRRSRRMKQTYGVVPADASFGNNEII